MNYKGERICKDAVIALFKVLSCICLERLSKTVNNLRIAGFLLETFNESPQLAETCNTNQVFEVRKFCIIQPFAWYLPPYLITSYSVPVSMEKYWNWIWSWVCTEDYPHCEVCKVRLQSSKQGQNWR